MLILLFGVNYDPLSDNWLVCHIPGPPWLSLQQAVQMKKFVAVFGLALLTFTVVSVPAIMY